MLGIGVILLLMACSSVSPVFPPNVPRKRDCPQVTIVDVPADLDRPLEDVVLQAGDRVQVKVYSVDKSLVPGCSKTFTVPARGVLNYPYLSKLQLRGKKLGEFKSLLDKALRGRVVKNPSITLEVLDFAPRRVTLVGLFVAPGVYELNPLKRRSLVLEVLDNGRGLRYNAARHRMILRRQNPFHFSQTILNWCELVKPGAEPIVLQGGDRLEVQVVEPLRIIGAVNKPIIELKYPTKPIRIQELVQLAGGLAEFAVSEIEIRRKGQDGKWGTIKVDYDEISKNPQSQHNLELLPGDRVSGHIPAWLQRIRNLKFGRLRFVPSYRQEVEFDDNVFLNDKGEGRGRESDVIFTERPGLRLELGYKKINAKLDYLGKIRHYLRNPELNTEGFAGDVHLDLDLGLNQDLVVFERQKARWFVRVTNDVSGRSDPIDLVDPELVARLKNVFKARSGFEFKRGEAYLEYRNSYLHVLKSQFKRVQHMQQTLQLGGKYKFSPRWSLELFVRPGEIDFDQDTLSDQRFFEVIAQARAELSPSLSTSLAVGYRKQEVTRQGDFADDSGFSGVVFNSSLRWDVGQRTRLLVGAQRELQLSSISNFKESTIGRVTLIHELIPQKLRAKLRLEVNHQRSSDSVESDDPRNTRLLAAIKLDYNFRSWLICDLTYQYQKNFSNQENGDFFRNLITLGANLKF